MLTAKYNALKDLESSGKIGLLAIDRLKETIKISKDFQKKLKEKDKEGFKDQIELCKNVKDTINVILDIFFGKEDERQGITARVPNTLTGRYSSAYRYTSNALHAPTETENKLITKFNEELDKAIDLVNDYFETEWPTFREEMESLDLGSFKEYEKIE